MTTTTSSGLQASLVQRVTNRWVQLVVMIIAMAAIANIQYAWTLFTLPLTRHYHVTLAAVQVAFSAFVLTETWLVPAEGYLIDRLGIRVMLIGGGVLVGLGWIGPGLWAPNVATVILWYALGGVGAGAVYGGSVGNAIKWFPDRRGLATGLVAGAYGVGTALTVAPVAAMIKSSGYAHAFTVWGIIQGAIVIAAAGLVTHPPAGWVPAGWQEKEAELRRSMTIRMSGRDLNPLQMLRQPTFWVLYVMMTLMAFTGLVITAQIAPIASYYHVGAVPLVLGFTALVLALEVDRIVNGLTRPFWGWISDHVGRENAMFVSFGLQALSIAAWIGLLGNPVWFVVFSGLAYFGWGNIFSLFPAAVGDLFGRRYATTNYGLMYTAKGLASIFSGPVVALIAAHYKGNWMPVFWIMAACSAIAALMALFWLKPITRRAVQSAPAETTAPMATVGPAH
jgi:OFA family oxalate/formate antiporter-like MFS transporter